MGDDKGRGSESTSVFCVSLAIDVDCLWSGGTIESAVHVASVPALGPKREVGVLRVLLHHC